jgi:thioredoxin reductase (NADPH)
VTKESQLDPTDPNEREAQTFPRLTHEQAARAASFGTRETLAKGAFVFERGQRNIDFFLVLEGNIEIFDRDEECQPQVFVVLNERQFTGEIDHFNERQVLVSGRTGAESRVVRIKRADFLRMAATENDIGEIIMRAFILRRVGLVRHSHGAVVLIGPAHGGDTIRIQRFLTRNAYPYRMLDTSTKRVASAVGEGSVVVSDVHRFLEAKRG